MIRGDLYADGDRCGRCGELLHNRLHAERIRRPDGMVVLLIQCRACRHISGIPWLSEAA